MNILRLIQTTRPGQPGQPGQPRGSILFVGLMVVTILAMLTLGFTGNIVTNQARTEADIAGLRALHLAQAYTNVKVQLLWATYQTIPTYQRILWVQGGTLNGVTYLPHCQMLPYSDNYNDGATAGSPGGMGASNGNKAFQPFGEGRAYCYTTCSQDTSGAVNVTLRTIAVVESYGEGSAGIDTSTGYLQTPRPTGDSITCSGIRTVAREVECVCSFGLGPAEVFDYVYFANNYGWMYGSTLNLYGNMGANGNLGFSGPPKVDGSLFAALNSAISAPGIVTGSANHDTLSQYKNIAIGPDGTVGTADDITKMMPTNPAAPGVAFAPGYDGTQPAATVQNPLNMPYLSDLTQYQQMASTQVVPARPDLGEPNPLVGGIVKQLKPPVGGVMLDPTDAAHLANPTTVPSNYTYIIGGPSSSNKGTYGFNGEPGMASTPTYDTQGNILTVPPPTNMPALLDTTTPTNNGNLALVGTPKQPIVVMGPVVISHDLVISGTMTGQGTFYVGRNVNVIGDTAYANAPTWLQNDFNVSTTATANQSKDGVGFGVKGNVVFGDYTHATNTGGTLGDGGDYWNSALSYIQPGFTAPYPVDAADANNGYVTSTVNGVPTFNGNYTATDGGAKYTSTSSVANTAPATTRRFYESSFAPQYIRDLATHTVLGGTTPSAYNTPTAGKPANVTGIFYCNHYLGGRLNNPNMYGTTIMRDEAMVVDGGANLLYDPRISKGALSSYINLYLPRAPIASNVVYHELRDQSGNQLIDKTYVNSMQVIANPATIKANTQYETNRILGGYDAFPPIPTRMTAESQF